jgi:hypothetical protein
MRPADGSRPWLQVHRALTAPGMWGFAGTAGLRPGRARADRVPAGHATLDIPAKPFPARHPRRGSRAAIITLTSQKARTTTTTTH